MLLVQDLKSAEGNPLPDNFLELLPEVCDICGMPFSIQPTLTSLSCINPRCADKVIARMGAALETLGVKGLGAESIASYVDEKGIINPLSILWADGDTNLATGVSFRVWQKVHEQIEAKNQRGYTLAEVVMLMGIPGVQTSAEKIFSGDESFTTVMERVKEGGVGYVQNALGIVAEGATSTRAIAVYEQLIQFEPDIADAVSKLNIKVKNTNLPSLTIVCSTAVGAPYKSKKHFADVLTERFGGKIDLKFGSSVTKSTDYLVWSGADGSPAAITSKVKTAMRWNEGREDDPVLPIVTGAGLVEILEEML